MKVAVTLGGNVAVIEDFSWGFTTEDDIMDWLFDSGLEGWIDRDQYDECYQRLLDEGYDDGEAWSSLADCGFITTIYGTAYDWTQLSIKPMPPNTETGLYDSMKDVLHHRYRKVFA